MDKAERAGLGVAVAGHVLLFGALTLTLPDAPQLPAPPPSVEVEFVDGAEVALTAEAPPAATTAPAPAPEVIESAEPEPAPEPVVAPAPEPLPAPPLPAPVAQPRPTPKAQPKVVERPAKAQPKAAARTAPKAAPKQAAAPRSRLGADFLKGIGSDPKPQAKAAGAMLTAASLAGIEQTLANRIKPCADRQINPGPGADKIVTRLRLRLRKDGSLAATPSVVNQSGTTAETQRFADIVAGRAIAAVRQCSPLRGLPPELYKTASGKGWHDTIFRYTP